MPAPQTALLHPAKGNVQCQIVGQTVIDADAARFHLSRQLPAQSFVARPDAGVQPIGGVVGQAQRLLGIWHAHDRQDRTEGLFAHDPHRVVHIDQDSWLIEEPRQRLVAPSTGERLSSLSQRLLHLRFDDLQLLRPDHCPYVYLTVFGLVALA